MSPGFLGRFAGAAGFAAGALLLLGHSARLGAQAVSLGFGGGIVVPSGDYGSVDKIGWHGMALANINIPSSPLGIRLEGTYGQTAHKQSIPGHIRLWGGTANLLAYVAPSQSAVRPYIFAGGGVYNVKIEVTGFGSASETNGAVGGGVGVSARLGARGAQAFFVEARVVSVRTSGGPTNFFPITAGLTFALR